MADDVKFSIFLPPPKRKRTWRQILAGIVWQWYDVQIPLRKWGELEFENALGLFAKIQHGDPPWRETGCHIMPSDEQILSNVAFADPTWVPALPLSKAHMNTVRMNHMFPSPSTLVTKRGFNFILIANSRCGTRAYRLNGTTWLPVDLTGFSFREKDWSFTWTGTALTGRTFTACAPHSSAAWPAALWDKTRFAALGVLDWLLQPGGGNHLSDLCHANNPPYRRLALDLAEEIKKERDNLALLLSRDPSSVNFGDTSNTLQYFGRGRSTIECLLQIPGYRHHVNSVLHTLRTAASLLPG